VTAGHHPAHRIGVVLVLDAESCTESGIVVVGDIGCGVDIGMAGAQGCVHSNSICYLQPRGVG
jgi:hypothetical protein